MISAIDGKVDLNDLFCSYRVPKIEFLNMRAERVERREKRNLAGSDRRIASGGLARS